MRLYLDDNSDSKLLAQLLEREGHDVVRPADKGVAGVADPIHLKMAVQEGCALLTNDQDDFRDLHELAQELKGQHLGILVVRRDNNPKRDLDEAGIVRVSADFSQPRLPLPTSSSS